MAKSTRTPEPRSSPVTLLDIARRVGVSKSTVSKALHGSAEIGEERTREIQTMAREMGYDPSVYHEARRLAARRSGHRVLNQQIAVVLPAFFYHANYFLQLFSGIMDVITPENFGLITVSEPDSRVSTTPVLVPPGLKRGEIDGVIVIGKAGSAMPSVLTPLRNCHAFETWGVVCMINQEHGYPLVTAAEEDGGYQAVRHLLGLGHRHLLFVRYEVTAESNVRRLQGMRQALAEHGLEPERHLHILNQRVIPPLTHRSNIAHAIPPSNQHPDRDRTLQYLREHPEITAVLAHNDLVAHRLWYLLHAAGKRIPDDYSLIGYDDVDPILDQHGRNILTTVRLPLYDIGQESARSVLRKAREGVEPPQRTVLPCQLMVRGTTAPPALR